MWTGEVLDCSKGLSQYVSGETAVIIGRQSGKLFDVLTETGTQEVPDAKIVH
jgi:hypothetical protein